MAYLLGVMRVRMRVRMRGVEKEPGISPGFRVVPSG